MKQKLLIALLFLFTGLFCKAQDIAVNISGPKAVATGSSVTYKIYVTNNSTTNATNVAVKAPNAANITEATVTYANGAGNGGSASTLSAATVTLANLQGSSGIVIPSLPSGSAGVFTVTGTASSSVSNINYTATVSFGGTDSNTSNNSATLTTNVYAATSCGTTTVYTLDVDQTITNNNPIGLNGGTINLYYTRTSGTAIAGLANSLIIPVTYSDLNHKSGVDNRWVELINDGGDLILAVNSTDGGTGSLYNSLPLINRPSSPAYFIYPFSGNISLDKGYTEFLRNGTIEALGTFNIGIGNLPTLPANVRLTAETFNVQGRAAANFDVNNPYLISGYFVKPIMQHATLDNPPSNTSNTLESEFEFGQTYAWRYTAYRGNGEGVGTSIRGAHFKGGNNITFTTATAIPTITTTAATCSANGTATISNYNGTPGSYTFSPTGPTVATGGVISGMTAGTTYTVTATVSGCRSNASAEFSVAASTSTAGTAAPIFNTSPVLTYNNISTKYSYKIPCGSLTANLSTVTASNKPTPSAVVITWHSSATATTANKITNVTAIAGTRKIYAAFYDTVNLCYSATQELTVQAPICASPDDYTTTPVTYGTTMTLTPSIFANDSYNGASFTGPHPSIMFKGELWTTEVVVNPNGTLTVTPSPTFGVGTHTLSYSICDKSPDAITSTACSNDVEVIIKIVAPCNAGTSQVPLNGTVLTN